MLQWSGRIISNRLETVATTPSNDEPMAPELLLGKESTRPQDLGNVLAALFDGKSLIGHLPRHMLRKIESELARIHELNMAIVENAPICIATTDKDGVFTSVNPAFAAQIGLPYEEAKRKVVGRFRWLENAYTVTCGLAEYLKKGLAGEAFALKEFPYITYRGDRPVFLDVQGIPIRGKDESFNGLLIIAEDATEKVKMRERLMLEAKAGALVELAMGIAHGLNNPLATIGVHSELALGLVQSLRSRLDGAGEAEKLASYLEIIEQETFRCKAIVTSLLKFITAKSFETEEIDLRKLVADLLRLANFNKKRVRTTRSFERGFPLINANFTVVRQVFWNILMNACDAVQGKETGRIRVRGRLVGDEAVSIEIEDNGEGIADEIKPRIFEPFFTTKTPDRGTGLGLTLTADLARKMGATVELVKSAKGKGSTFRVILPRSGRISGE